MRKHTVCQSSALRLARAVALTQIIEPNRIVKTLGPRFGTVVVACDKRSCATDDLRVLHHIVEDPAPSTYYNNWDLMFERPPASTPEVVLQVKNS